MNKVKRIAIVANTSFNIINFRTGLIKALKKNDYEVILIAPEDKHTEELISLTNCPFYPLKGLARKGTNPLKDLLLIAEFFYLYRKLNPDIVLQYTIKPNIYGTIGAFLSGTKSICTVTGLGYVFLNKGVSSTIAKWLYKIAFNLTEKVLFQNNDDRKLFCESKLVKQSKAGYVPGSGMDTDYFHPSYCSPLPEKNLTTTFVMIARLLIDKGLREFITAARNIKRIYPTSKFILLGDLDEQNPAGISREELNNFIKEGFIDYRGFVKDTRKVICEADVVVLPSYREGMPRVILEGMAMGKPCIVSDAPGCRDTIEEGISGYFCKTADAYSLQTAMERFIHTPETERIKMGMAARKRVEETFSLHKVAETYLELIRQMEAIE
jgi:glycosyltransferase involved in cell wall biosynthesis